MKVAIRDLRTMALLLLAGATGCSFTDDSTLTGARVDQDDESDVRETQIDDHGGGAHDHAAGAVLTERLMVLKVQHETAEPSDRNALLAEMIATAKERQIHLV